MLESFFIKITGLKGCNFVKKRIQQRCFPVSIAASIYWKYVHSSLFLDVYILIKNTTYCLQLTPYILLSLRVFRHNWWNMSFSGSCYCKYPFLNLGSRLEVFCEKGVLRNSTKFTGMQLCQSLCFNEVAGLRP